MLVICAAMGAFIFFWGDHFAFLLAMAPGNTGGTPRLASVIALAPILVVGLWVLVTLLFRDLRRWLAKIKRKRTGKK